MAAKKKQTKKRKASLDVILATVERGFADVERKMNRGFAAVADDIAEIKSTIATKADIADMATKEDVRAIVRDELALIRSELKSVRGDLDDLREKVENVIGFQKEIGNRRHRKALGIRPNSTRVQPQPTPPLRRHRQHRPYLDLQRLLKRLAAWWVFLLHAQQHQCFVSPKSTHRIFPIRFLADVEFGTLGSFLPKEERLGSCCPTV
jgi:hypothetical protein